MIDKRGFPIFWYKVRSGHLTALHLAVRRSWGALEVMLDHPDADPELRCDTGRKDWQRSSTPLHSAVEHDYYEAVKLLSTMARIRTQSRRQAIRRCMWRSCSPRR